MAEPDPVCKAGVLPYIAKMWGLEKLGKVHLVIGLQDSEGQAKHETSESSGQETFKKAPRRSTWNTNKGQKLKEDQWDENKIMNQKYWLS